MLSGAARDLAPHDVAFYLRDLAGHSTPITVQSDSFVEDAALARARMALLEATRTRAAQR